MKLITTSFFLCLCFLLSAQNSDIIANEYIIQLEEKVDGFSFFEKIKKENSALRIFQLEKKISERLNIYKITTANFEENEKAVLDVLNQFPEIKLAGQNFKVEARTNTPDDPLYSTQWDMEMIQAPDVWEITTGGVTPLGDTIVIAVVEGGDYTHEDLIDNLWINHHEIDNDGIDNDGNGYIDDKFGWNATDENDDLVDRVHSTKVAGIVGASGDNDKGITGVNWNVKVMFVHSNLNFDKIIESYEYIYATRKLFNDTNGEKGAFIVTSNSSFGKGRSQLADNPLFPVWCEMYNTMGEVGVLSAGATDNGKYDVTLEGDIPSLCSSDHLIVVTNNNSSDTRNGAWGKTHVDLAAPGDNSPSTGFENSYSDLDGTSAATPHVAGGIALLYSLPCEKLAREARETPQATALLMKDFILNGVDPIVEQADETVSGGRLNLKNSMDFITAYCGTELGILNVDKVSPNPTADFLDVAFTPNTFGIYQIRIYNVLGQLVQESEIEASQFLPAQFTLDVQRFKAGTYFLSLENLEDQTAIKFIVH